MGDRVYRHELDPVAFLHRSATVFPDRTAVVHGDRHLTYRELEERSRRLASALLERGLEKGDRVAFLAPNIPALLEAHFGVPGAGGVLVAINTRLSGPDVEYIVEHSGSRILFVDRELAHLAPTGIETVVIADTGGDDDEYEQFLAGGTASFELVPVQDEEDVISINYTSGTTGRQKGVMYTFRGTYLNALGEVIEANLRYGSVFLWTLPMFHCNGWCFTWAVTAVAGTHVCLRKVEPDLVWDLLRDEGVTHYNGAPTVQISLVNSPNARRLDREVTVAVAGAPPSPTLLAQMRALNLRPVHLYGLTETYGPHTVSAWHPEWGDLDVEEQARLLARQGLPYVTARARPCGRLRAARRRHGTAPSWVRS